MAKKIAKTAAPEVAPAAPVAAKAPKADRKTKSQLAKETPVGAAAAPRNNLRTPEIVWQLNEDGEVTRTDVSGTITVAHYYPAEKRLALERSFAAKYRNDVLTWMTGEMHAQVDTVHFSDETPDRNDPTKQPPRKTIEQGDKTPVYVEWMKKHRPKEYAARYGVIGEGTVIKEVKIRGEDGTLVPSTIRVPATIAHRKTHLTEKVASGAELDSGESLDQNDDNS